MSYRKIIINDVVFEYVVGKVNVHIKGPNGSFDEPVSKISELMRTDCGCGCGGDECPSYSEDYAVTPNRIRQFILANVKF